MRRAPFVHLLLGSLVVTSFGIAGRMSRIDELFLTTAVPQSVSWSMSPSAHAPSKVIVKMRPGTLITRLLAEFARFEGFGPGGMGATPVDEMHALAGLSVLDFSSESTARRAVDLLRRDPRVEFAELDALWHVDSAPVSAPDDARYAEQWGLENTGQAVNGGRAGKAGVDIDARTAWSMGNGSKDVVIAVIDSGIDVNHEDLKANLWINEAETPGNGVDDDGNGVIDDVNGFNAIDGSGNPADDVGHGTHVAGIIGAAGDNGRGIAGVNWSTRIMSLKFLGTTGGGSTSDAIRCIDYLETMRKRGENIKAVNCSWGSTVDSLALRDAMESSGVLFVCAAGNDATNNDLVPHYPSSFESDNVVSVAALARDDSMASFSNWGEKSVDVAAPGADILSTLPGGNYGYASGTSMAAPFVTGVAGLVAAGAPNLTIASLRDRLVKRATAVDAFAGRIGSGGRLSGSGAMNASAT